MNLIRIGLEILTKKLPADDEIVTSFYNQTKGFCTLLSKSYLNPKDQLNFLWSVNYVVYIFNLVTNRKHSPSSNFVVIINNSAFERAFVQTSTSLLKYFYHNAVVNDYTEFDHYKDVFNKTVDFSWYLEGISDRSKFTSSNIPIEFTNIVNIDLLLILSKRELRRWHKAGVKVYTWPIVYTTIPNRTMKKI